MSIEVSFIIPIFNKVKYLGHCLESVFNQTLGAMEVICINDASSDGSDDILEDFRNSEPRLRIIENSKNFGAAYSRNKGIMAAKGKFLRFVDADDLLPLESTKLMYETAMENDVDLVRGSLGIFDDDKPKDFQDIISVPERMRTEFSREKCLWIPWWHTSYLISAELVRRNKLKYPRLTRGEDPVFMTAVLLKARYISLVEDVVYLYRKYPKTSGSIGSKTRNVRDTFKHAAMAKKLFCEADPRYWYQGYGPFLLHDVRTFLDTCKLNAKMWDFVDSETKIIWDVETLQK